MTVSTRLRPGPLASLRLLAGLPKQARLCWRLLGERRVGVLPKAVLVAALAYVALPVDVLPDFLPGVGQLDDLTLLATAAYLFVRWCPPSVVAEHQAALSGGSPG